MENNEFEFEFKKIKNANNFNNAPFQKSKKTDIEFLTTKKKTAENFSQNSKRTLSLYIQKRIKFLSNAKEK